MTPPTLSFRNQLYLSLLCYVLIAGMIAFNIVARIGFNIPYAVILGAGGIALLFCSLGVVHEVLPQSKWLSLPYTTVGLLVLLSLIGYLPQPLGTAIGWLAIILGYSAAFYTLYQLLKTCKFTTVVFRHLPVAALFALWCIGLTYSINYISPLFLEELTFGMVHKDALFHMSISQMFKTHHLPSTGLDGIPFMAYHWGSHYVLAIWSAWLPCTVEQAYNFIYPICFIPLFFYWLLQAALKAAEYFRQTFSIEMNQAAGFIFWVLLFVGVQGLIPPELNKFGIHQSIALFSQSYNLSITVLFLLLYVLLGLRRIPTIPEKLTVLLLVCLAYVMKMSVGLLLVPALAYLQFRRRQFFRWQNLAFWIFGLVCVFVCYKLVSSSSLVQFGWFDYIRTFTEVSAWYYFLPFYFATIIVFLLVAVYREEQKAGTNFSWRTAIVQARLLEAETLIVIALISLLPGILLVIGGGSAGYFSDVPRKVGLVFFLSCVPVFADGFIKSYKHRYIQVTAWIVLLPVFSGFLHIISKQVLNVVAKTINVRYEITGRDVRVSQSYPTIQAQLANNPKYQFLMKLDSLDKLPRSFKSEHLIHINRTDTTFYNWMGHNPWARAKWAGALIVPAISGIAMINGLPPVETIKNFDYYGFLIYRRRNFPLADENQPPDLEARKNLVGLPDKKVLLLSTGLTPTTPSAAAAQKP